VSAEAQKDAKARLETLLQAQDVDESVLIETLGNENWVEKTLQDLAPVRAGRFVVHGSHDADCAAPHEHAICINAGMAFGTGHHGTTAGCLAMIDRELKRSAPRNALDLGSGTGVLAIAIAKAAHIPVLATDIDPVAAHIARQNARANQAGGYVDSIAATSFNHTRFLEYVPFDLVVANILAGPLQAMAHDLSRHLASGAGVILSGLLPHQRARILAGYRAQGLAHDHTHYQDGWMTLVLRNMR
jgi:ribosomal protein L11 methyltransferase